MFPLCFRLCQKGKEYKINTWISFVPNSGIFIPNFPLALPRSADWLSWWQGFVSEPPAEHNVGTGVGVGERPQHTGAPAQPSHISSGHWLPFLGTHCPPEEQPKLFHSALINPGLSALGKVTLFIKMPLWVSKKKKKVVVAPWWSVFKEKNLVCTAQSPKELEALTHTHPTKHRVFSVFTLALG